MHRRFFVISFSHESKTILTRGQIGVTQPNNELSKLKQNKDIQPKTFPIIKKQLIQEKIQFNFSKDKTKMMGMNSNKGNDREQIEWSKKIESRNTTDNRSLSTAKKYCSVCIEITVDNGLKNSFSKISDFAK